MFDAPILCGSDEIVSFRSKINATNESNTTQHNTTQPRPAEYKSGDLSKYEISDVIGCVKISNTIVINLIITVFYCRVDAKFMSRKKGNEMFDFT